MAEKAINKLSMKPSFQLMKWLENNADRVADLTDVETAKQASAELGFSVIPAHVGPRRKELGIERKQKLDEAAKTQLRLTAVEEATRVLIKSFFGALNPGMKAELEAELEKTGFDVQTAQSEAPLLDMAEGVAV